MNEQNNDSKIRQVQRTGTYPNIYHILLDAHSSNYVLKKYYNFNNDFFYQELQKEGFVAFENSFSQYPATQMSVASMLNLDYLQEQNLQVKVLESMRVLNKVFSVFYDHNFEIHLFDRTLQMSYGPNFKKKNASNYFLYWMWVSHTPLKWTFQKFFAKQAGLDHADNIELDLEDLVSAEKIYGKHNNLFYAHIVCPHAPFIYGEKGDIDISQGLIGMFTDARGNFASSKEELLKLKNKYISTLKVIDQKILKLISTILSQYDKNNQPIIVLHSDHGTCLTTISPVVFDSYKCEFNQLNVEQEQLYGNLLCVYCPEAWRKDINTISLVNLYRFIFNHLFNANYSYLRNYCCIKK